MRLFDTHAHVLDEHFDADRDALMEGLPGQGIVNFVECCCSKADFEKVIAFTRRWDFVFGALGVHPENALEYDDAVLPILRPLLAEKKIVAVGEIGLDYHYEDGAPRELQKRCFLEQVRLAKEVGLPVIIHDRDAHGDMMDLLRAERQGLSGIMHCFSGSYEMAKECMDDGLYIAFGGAVTFKNARKQREIASKIPLDRLLIETDCPYMTPEPFRGTRNDPGKVKNTLLVLAEVRGMDPERLAEATETNARLIFGLDRQ